MSVSSILNNERSFRLKMENVLVQKADVLWQVANVDLKKKRHIFICNILVCLWSYCSSTVTLQSHITGRPSLSQDNSLHLCACVIVTATWRPSAPTKRKCLRSSCYQISLLLTLIMIPIICVWIELISNRITVQMCKFDLYSTSCILSPGNVEPICL